MPSRTSPGRVQAHQRGGCGFDSERALDEHQHTLKQGGAAHREGLGSLGGGGGGGRRGSQLRAPLAILRRLDA